MKRFKIHNTVSGLRFVVETETLVMQPEHGNPERQEPATTELGEPIFDSDGNPVMVTIPAEYEIVEEDMTAELAENAKAEFAAQKSAECEAAIQALLGNTSDVTHLMLALYNVYVAANISGEQAEGEIEAAKAQLQSYLALMQEVQALRLARDEAVEGYGT